MNHRLLIITQKVDVHDQLLGFFPAWLREFAKHSERVEVVCLWHGDAQLPDNVRVHSLGKERGIGKIRQLFIFYYLLFTLRRQYDAVFVHMNPIWMVLGGPVWRIMRKRATLWYTHKSVTLKLRVATFFAQVIFTASSESFRLKSKKVMVTGHGIDTDLFKPNYELRITNNGVLKILSVGRIAPVKNYDVLVAAAKLLQDQGIDFYVTMVGEAVLAQDRAYAHRLKERIQELGLADRFRWVGNVTHEALPEYYRSHDVFVHMSRTGSLDKVILEAMACGIRVISSNDASRAFLPPEVIIAEDDPRQLAEKLMTGGVSLPDSAMRDYVVAHHSMSRLVRTMSDILIPRRRVLVAGYSYVTGIYLKTFDSYPYNREDLFFVLPKVWPIKKGIYTYHAPQQENVYPARAFFFHSKYPFIGGTLKGWMPIFPWVLIQKWPKVVYSVSEPNMLPTLYQGICAKLIGAKHVIMTWENLSYKKKLKGLKGFLQKCILRMNIALCDHFVCGTKKSRDIMRELTDRPITVMPSTGMNTEFYTCHPPRRATRPGGSVTFAFIGALDYRKGVHLIVMAFTELAAAFPQIRLCIVGNGSYEREIEKLIAQSGVQDRIIRKPWLDLDGVRQAMQDADVFLYPSIPHAGWEEQFGFALAEASLMELPIITTRSGSIPEVVSDGKTGILVEPDDTIQLKNAMQRLAQDPQLRHTLGVAGRAFICEHFSYPVIAQKFYHIFNTV